MTIKHVKVSSIIQHMGQGYGFKLTFLDLNETNSMKPKVIKYLEKEGYIVTNLKGSYYEQSG